APRKPSPGGDARGTCVPRCVADGPLLPGGPGLRRLPGCPPRGWLERLDRARLIKVQHRVELTGQARVEVVTHALGLRRVDHANRALETLVMQRVRHVAAVAQSQEEARQARVVKEPLIASFE